jgi:hypothetical protein
VIARARLRRESAAPIAAPRGYKRLWFLLLAPLAFALTSLAAAFPDQTERLYARGLYPLLSGAIGRLTGLLPFSLIEMLMYIAIVSAITFLAVKIRGIVQARGKRRDRLLRLLATIAAILSVWYFLSTILCGLNYHRQTFTDYSGLFVRASSVEELAALCGELVSTANDLRETLPEDENGVMTTAFASHYEQAAFAGAVYGNLGAVCPLLGGYTPRPKPVFASRAMSHMNIVGIFIPFTYECSVNTDVADYNIPSSMMHELSHYKGFMREDEANFLAWLACTYAGNAEFAYSGALLALIHSTNALYASDAGLYGEIMAPLTDAVRRDIAANNAPE